MGTAAHAPYIYISAMIKRLALTLLLAATATACSSSATPPARVAAWQGGTTGMLYMRVISQEELKDARLTMPDGRKILARRLSQPEPSYAGSGEGWSRPSVGVGGSAGSGGDFGTGIGLSFPLGGGGGGSRLAGQSSQVEFALDQDQLADYRAQSHAWLLELNFGSRVDSLPAPTIP